MKRTLLTLFCTLLALAASADEGMWLPSLISQRIDDMRAKGFRLTAEDIYSINKASMKDAVVLFNGGCTGELISSEGMLLTNHHCGYDAIQAHSSVEHDYLTNGFWAMSRREELPNKELNVRFLVRMEEVTDRIAAGETKAEIIRRAEAESKGYKASVEQMYYGNQQFLFIYEQFDDVRLVGAPPSSIGKFGGDTDNWIWPRHTGDFSLFRIYAGKDNKPAAYSPENVPYRPKRHFTISTAGVEEGDFTMIYGFPGNTQEYILSDAVAYIAERSDPAKIAIRTGRLDIISAAQESDPALRIHYAAKHASIANAWKKWQGEALGIGRLGTVASKRAYEQEFAAWAQDKPEYRSVVADLKAEYARIADAYFAREITRETLGALPERYTPEERAEAAFARREQTERALFEWLFGQYARRCPVQYQIPAFLAGVAASGSPEAYAGEVFDTLWREGADTRRCTPYTRTPNACSATSAGCWKPSRCATSTAAASTNSTRPTSRGCASGTPCGPSTPTPTSRCAWPTAMSGATNMPTANTTNRRPPSTASSPRTTPRFTTTTSRRRCASSMPRRTTDAGRRRSTAAGRYPSASWPPTTRRAATPVRRSSTAGANWWG